MFPEGKMNYYEIEPEQSQFYTVGIEVTHKCNMECANCYSPIRDIPDIPKEKIIEFVKRLGRRTEIRLSGGEPTLRKDLAEIIYAIKELGHRPAVMTNGLLLNKSRVQELRDAGLNFICLSLNGADDDDVYEALDHRRCSKLKMSALKNLSEAGFFLNINCIVAKGINEHVPARLIEILRELKTNGVLRFRNIGKLGRYQKIENLSFLEMIDLVAKPLGKSSEEVLKYNRVNGYEEKYNILFPIDSEAKYSTTWIKITDWRPTEESIPDPDSKRRGRMTSNFKVAPFFEHSSINGY